jgi:hypothetical protein
MVDPTTTAEQLIDTLGIADPRDLDINAIAYYCGATIVYEPLTGCEANIVGYGDKAIITVNLDSHPGRKRFSAGHELGHWMKDRGESAFGCTEKQLDSEWSVNNPETRANRFASDLLLPKRLFTPLVERRPIALETLHDLANTFQMSLTATAIKLVELGSYPAMLLCYDNGTRKWFIRPREVPQVFFPPTLLPSSTITSKLLSDQSSKAIEGDVRTDRWFDHPKADRYYIRESCFRTGDDSVVTMLWWEDEQQIMDIEEEEERKAARRADWRDE